MPDLNSKTVVELKQQLKELGLPISGVKSDLISRLELEEDRIRIFESIPPDDLEKMEESKEVVGEFLYTPRGSPSSLTDILIFSFLWLLAYALLKAGMKWLGIEVTHYLSAIFDAIWLIAILVYLSKVSLKRVMDWKNEKKIGNAPLGQIFTTRNPFTPKWPQEILPGMEYMKLEYWFQFEGMRLKRYWYGIKTEKGLFAYLWLKHGMEYFGPTADLLYWEEE